MVKSGKLSGKNWKYNKERSGKMDITSSKKLEVEELLQLLEETGVTLSSVGALKYMQITRILETHVKKHGIVDIRQEGGKNYHNWTKSLLDVDVYDDNMYYSHIDYEVNKRIKNGFIREYENTGNKYPLLAWIKLLEYLYFGDSDNDADKINSSRVALTDEKRYAHIDKYFVPYWGGHFR